MSMLMLESPKRVHDEPMVESPRLIPNAITSLVFVHSVLLLDDYSKERSRLTTTTFGTSELGSCESDRADILQQRDVGIRVVEDDLGTIEEEVELVREARELKSRGHDVCRCTCDVDTRREREGTLK